MGKSSTSERSSYAWYSTWLSYQIAPPFDSDTTCTCRPFENFFGANTSLSYYRVQRKHCRSVWERWSIYKWTWLEIINPLWILSLMGIFVVIFVDTNETKVNTNLKKKLHIISWLAAFVPVSQPISATGIVNCSPSCPEICFIIVLVESLSNFFFCCLRCHNASVKVGSLNLWDKHWLPIYRQVNFSPMIYHLTTDLYA